MKSQITNSSGRINSFPLTLMFIIWCSSVLFCSLAFAGIEQAEICFLRGDYAGVVKNCDNTIALKNNINSADAYYLKGRACLRQNRLAEARDCFKRVLADFSASSFTDEAQLGLGDLFFAEGDFDAAIGEYRKVQEKYPKSGLLAITLYKLGRSYLSAGRAQESRFYFQKLQMDYPLSFESKLVDELDDAQFAHSVQVGCFSKYENAEKMAAKLKKAGFDAYVSEKEGHPVFYRVRVGKFKTRWEAKRAKDALQKKGYKTKICP